MPHYVHITDCYHAINSFCVLSRLLHGTTPLRLVDMFEIVSFVGVLQNMLFHHSTTNLWGFSYTYRNVECSANQHVSNATQRVSHIFIYTAAATIYFQYNIITCNTNTMLKRSQFLREWLYVLWTFAIWFFFADTFAILRYSSLGMCVPSAW